MPTTAVDQHGAAVAVGGMSGITWLGGNRYAIALDNSDVLITLEIEVGPSGSIGPVESVGALRLGFAGDHEAIAVLASGEVLIADEQSMTLRRADLATGAFLGFHPLPDVYTNRRVNRGIESLTLDGDVAWAANEEALAVDGSVATPTASTLVRLQSLNSMTGQPLGQWAYRVEPMHGAAIPGGNPGQSGLVELVALPGGSLLALERSLALANPVLLTRMYVASTGGATDVSQVGNLAASQISLVTKAAIYTGSHANLEGLCLGPSLGDGSRVLMGVVDNGDPFSANQLVVFRIDGLDGSGACEGDLADDFGAAGADGVVSFGDFLRLLSLLGTCPLGQPGCEGDIADDFGSPAPDGLVSFGDFLRMLTLLGPCS